MMALYAVLKLPDENELSLDDAIDPSNKWDRVMEATAALTVRTIDELRKEDDPTYIMGSEEISFIKSSSYGACGWMLVVMKHEGLLIDEVPDRVWVEMGGKI